MSMRASPTRRAASTAVTCKAGGATVRTTAEILLTELTDVVFRRRPDVRTGYRELVIEPRQAPR